MYASVHSGMAKTSEAEQKSTKHVNMDGWMANELLGPQDFVFFL